MKNLKRIYENFHTLSKCQLKVVKKSNFTYRNILTEIDKYFKNKSSVLDIGCGAGTISLYLAFKGQKVFGIDTSQKSIELCSKSASILKLEDNVTFEQMNFPDEYPRKVFDYILCIEVLEHIKNDNEAIKNIFSLLKPGGVAIISVPSIRAPLYLLEATKKFDYKVGHLRRYYFKDIKEKCLINGFIILNSKVTEGILRNSFFIFPFMGKFVKFIKGPISALVSFLDELTIHFFGGSDIVLVLKKE